MERSNKQRLDITAGNSGHYNRSQQLHLATSFPGSDKHEITVRGNEHAHEYSDIAAPIAHKYSCPAGGKRITRLRKFATIETKPLSDN